MPNLVGTQCVHLVYIGHFGLPDIIGQDPKKPKKPNSGERTRTSTGIIPLDFESSASANSATPPGVGPIRSRPDVLPDKPGPIDVQDSTKNGLGANARFESFCLSIYRSYREIPPLP